MRVSTLFAVYNMMIHRDGIHCLAVMVLYFRGKLCQRSLWTTKWCYQRCRL